MKHALPLTFLAGPALAHEGAHAHPHGVEGWLVALCGLLVVAAVAVFLKARK